MSLYSARATKVDERTITLTTGETVKAMGNRRFFPGDMVWTDGKYAYGFQGRGGSFLWDEGLAGVPLFIYDTSKPAGTPNQGILDLQKMQVKMGSKYVDPVSGYDITGRQLVNNKNHWYYCTEKYYGSSYTLQYDAYMDDAGRTAVFTNCDTDYAFSGDIESRYVNPLNFLDTKEVWQYHAPLTPEEQAEQRRIIRDPETVDEENTQLKVYYHTGASTKTRCYPKNVIVVYDLQGNQIGECDLTTEAELKSYAGEILNHYGGLFADVHLTSAREMVHRPRIDSGKLTYYRTLSLSISGLVKNQCYIFADEEHIIIDLYDVISYYVSQSAGMQVIEFVEADFDMETCTVSNKRVTRFKVDYGLRVAKNKRFDDYIDASYTFLYHYEHLYGEDSPFGEPQTPEEYRILHYAPERETISVDSRQEVDMLYPLQDGLWADGHGVIYDANKTKLVETTLTYLRAALPISNNAWLLLGDDVNGTTIQALRLYKDGKIGYVGSYTIVLNRRLYKFNKSLTKRFLAGKESP